MLVTRTSRSRVMPVTTCIRQYLSDVAGLRAEPDEVLPIRIGRGGEESGQVRRGHRPAEVIALSTRAPELEQALDLFGVLDAFGDSVDAERGRQYDQPFRHRIRVDRVGQFVGERLIDLDDVG